MMKISGDIFSDKKTIKNHLNARKKLWRFSFHTNGYTFYELNINPQSQVTQEIDFKTTLYRKKSSQESAYVSLSFSE